jgi:hypothetical protein
MNATEPIPVPGYWPPRFVPKDTSCAKGEARVFARTRQCCADATREDASTEDQADGGHTTGAKGSQIRVTGLEHVRRFGVSLDLGE